MSMAPRKAAFALVFLALDAACGRASADGTAETSAEESTSTEESTDAESGSTGGDEIDDSTTGTPSCEVVEFADPALEQYVRDALSIADGPISGDDMLTLTTIHVELAALGDLVELHDLSGLECAVNLEELTWEDGVASDFGGLEPLEGLSKLGILVLGGGPIVDFGPLTGLGQLEHLSWPNLETTDLTPLAGLTNLRILLLSNNAVTDVSPLAGLTNLEQLDLRSSPSFDSAIADISALAGLVNLRQLDINGNQVIDVSPLAGLAKLEELKLQLNGVVDVEPLANLPSLHTLDALGNPIVDVSPLASLAQVYNINLSGAQITDLSGWVGHTWQSPMGCADIILTINPLTEQTIAQDLPQICMANPDVAIWIGLGEEAFCNPSAACP